jgi:hypothetical protein
MPLIVRTFKVGNYTCTCMLPLPKSGEVKHVDVAWHPHVPPAGSLTDEEVNQYRIGREAAYVALAKKTGLMIAVPDGAVLTVVNHRGAVRYAPTLIAPEHITAYEEEHNEGQLRLVGRFGGPEAKQLIITSDPMRIARGKLAINEPLDDTAVMHLKPSPDAAAVMGLIPPPDAAPVIACLAYEMPNLMGIRIDPVECVGYNAATLRDLRYLARELQIPIICCGDSAPSITLAAEIDVVISHKQVAPQGGEVRVPLWGKLGLVY